MQPISDPFSEEEGLASVAISGTGQNLLDADLSVKLPASLSSALEKRRIEFLLGRQCAALALKKLSPEIAASEIGILSDRSPEWPPEIVGAITHCEGYTAAIVGRKSKFIGLGRDTEPLLTKSTFSEIRRLVALPAEIETLAQSLSWDEYKTLTLIYSAKESLYKCLAPPTGIFFEFSDARVEPNEKSPNTYRIHLLKPLGEKIPKGITLVGDFVLQEALLHTRCLLRNKQK